MEMLVRVLALVWLGTSVIAVIVGVGLIWIADGFEVMVDTMRPRDVVAYAVIVLMLLPPVLLLLWAESWRRWRRRRTLRSEGKE